MGFNTIKQNAFWNQMIWILLAICMHRIAKTKGKDRKSIYIVPFIYYVYLKALRHGSHSFTCKYTMPAFPS